MSIPAKSRVPRLHVSTRRPRSTPHAHLFFSRVKMQRLAVAFAGTARELVFVYTTETSKLTILALRWPPLHPLSPASGQRSRRRVENPRGTARNDTHAACGKVSVCLCAPRTRRLTPHARLHLLHLLYSPAVPAATLACSVSLSGSSPLLCDSFSQGC